MRIVSRSLTALLTVAVSTSALALDLGLGEMPTVVADPPGASSSSAPAPDPVTDRSTALPSTMGKNSWFYPTTKDLGPRNVYWRPLVSIILPGFDQYLAGHWVSAGSYTAVAVAGSAWGADREDKWKKFRDDNEFYRHLNKEDKSDYQFHDELGRQTLLAEQITQDIGFLSAYHSFRTSVATQQEVGKYQFLTKEETPGELLLAPFKFSYLARPTTFIPLAIVAGLGVADNQTVPKDRRRRNITGGDAFYSGAVSYNAGVSEEALFRGYIHPLMYEAWDAPVWSNLAQATLFALAHLGTNDAPVAQFGLGYYLGWLSARSEWTVSEGIFIHAWWDVIAISTEYLTEKKVDPKSAVIWTPAFRMAF